jgi:hypothetical protein
MLNSRTHFEQIPLEAIKTLVPEEIREDKNAERLEQTKEEDSKTSLRAEE